MGAARHRPAGQGDVVHGRDSGTGTVVARAGRARARWWATVVAAACLVVVGLVPAPTTTAEAAVVGGGEPRAEYLLEVEPGARLGRGGRYVEYQYGDASPWNWASVRCSTLVAEGALVRLVSACTPGRLVTTLMDPVALRVVSRLNVARTETLDLVGGVAVLGGDVYVLSGQANPQERGEAEVLRVSRYSPGLAHLGSAGIRSDAVAEAVVGVRTPFLGGSADLALDGTTLVVHTSREMHTHVDGLNHQANVTLVLDTTTMTGLAQAKIAYASHSFNQLLAVVGGRRVLVDHGDAFPRTLRMVVAAPGASPRTYTLATLAGTVGDNVTGATVNGLAVSGQVAAVAGLSSPHDHAVAGVEGLVDNAAGQKASNVYVALVDVVAGTQSFVWLTDNHPTTSTTMVGQPSITALPSGDFAVLFHAATQTADGRFLRRTHYRLVSPSGVVLARAELAPTAHLPTSPPVTVGDRLVWVAPPESTARLASVDGDGTRSWLRAVDVSDPAAPSDVVRVAAAPSPSATPSATPSPSPSATASASPGASPSTTPSAPTRTAAPAPTSATASAPPRTAAPAPGGTSARRFTSAPRPKVVGTARVGRTLTARAGTWRPAAKVSYRWLRDGRPVPGATREAYTLKAADKGRKVSVRVTARRTGYAATTKVSATRKVAAGRFTSAPRPKVVGTARVGRRLTARVGTWRPAAKVSYQWLRSGRKITGATSPRYRVRAADKGRRISVRVTAVRAGFARAAVTSRATAVVRAR